MKNIAIMLVAELACLASIAGAVFLAYHGKEGWGWMIVLALATVVSHKVTT
jgi:hypothetical protein